MPGRFQDRLRNYRTLRCDQFVRQVRKGACDVSIHKPLDRRDLLRQGDYSFAAARPFLYMATGSVCLDTIPRIVLVMPTLMIVLAALAWYATVFHYQSSGWIVTAFTTLIAVLAALNLSNWSTHRQHTGETIAAQPGTRIATDLVILVMGVGFAYLTFFICGGF
jgi:hypothetical protein